MASESRSALADITPSQYSFYQLLELLYKRAGKNADPDKDTLPEHDIVRFNASGSLAFPSSDLTTLTQDKQGRHLLEVAFLGLQGSQSPLPGFYLEPLAWEYAQEEPGVIHFLNLFNHRAITLLHRIWRKYRYYISFKNNGQDIFSQRMFALVGLENPAIRRALRVNHSKMLAYAGLLSGTSRSPDILCGLIAHCFDLTDVTLLPWQFRRVDIPDDQQTILGTSNSLLGENFVIGDYVHDCSGKFTLCLNNLSIKRYMSFLPSGENYLPLKTFVAFILRDQFAFDVNLSLAPEQLMGMELGDDITCLLGWTTFIGEAPANPSVTLCMRT